MAARKTTAAKSRTNTNSKTRRRKPAARTKKSNGNFINFFVPFFFIVCILFCLGFIFLMGYRTVTASTFFDINRVEIVGANHADKDEIEKIVKTNVEKSGVWNADLSEIRREVEQSNFIKAAAVSRILPDRVRVNVIERVPKAVVRIEGGDFWADDDGVIISAVGKNEDRPPFFLQGWNRDKTEKAVKENQERVKMYLEMLEDWREYELAKRVVAVDLSDVREPQAIVEDSGEQVKIVFSDEVFGKSLKRALEITANRGKEIESVIFDGVNARAISRKS